MTDTPDGAKVPATTYPILPLLAGRWSPRGLDTSHVLTDDELGSVLEAARWTPSANNSQPWRFIVGLRGSETFDTLFGALTGGNLAWADRASALLIMLAEVADAQGKPRKWAEYDAGQAAAHLTIQAESMGLSVHQMAGFDKAKVSEAFDLPDTLKPVTAVAIGVLDPAAELVEPFATREREPRVRKPLSELVVAGWSPPRD